MHKKANAHARRSTTYMYELLSWQISARFSMLNFGAFRDFEQESCHDTCQVGLCAPAMAEFCDSQGQLCVPMCEDI